MATDLVNHAAEWIEETVPGTTPTDPVFNWFGKIQTITPSIEATKNEAYGMDTVDATAPKSSVPESMRTSQMKYAFKLEVKPQKSATGYDWTKIIQQILGSATAAIDAEKFHTVYAVSYNDAGVATNFTYVGVLFVDYEISVDEGGDVVYTLDCMAMDRLDTAPTIGGGSHAADPGTEHLISTDVVITRGVTEVANTNSVTFKIARANDENRAIRSTDPEKVVSLRGGQFNFTASLTVNAKDNTELAWVGVDVTADLEWAMDSKTLTLEEAEAEKYETTLDVASRITPIELPFKGLDMTIA